MTARGARDQEHPHFEIQVELKGEPLLFEEALNPAQDRGVHCRGDAAGLGILLARVIDTK